MNKKKILIVEDERIIAEDLRQTLQRLGYAVTGIAATGNDALKKAAANIPDLVIMDIMLRGRMDGITVAERLRERFDVPSIYLTAYADDTIMKRAKISAPYGYILKPFEEKELHTNVEIALERSKTNRLLRRTNMVLKTVRDINQLIVQELDRRKLIQQACKMLTEEKCYPRAWVVLLDEANQITMSAQSGWGQKFQLLLQMLKRGEMPDCARKALKRDDVVIRSGSAPCPNCPFREFYPEYYNLTIALNSHGETYGLLSVALPERIPVEEPEKDLFREMAGDIAFGLHDLKLEELRCQLEETLQKSEEKYRTLTENAQDSIFVIGRGDRIEYINTYGAAQFGKRPADLIGKLRSDLFPKEIAERQSTHLKKVFRTGKEIIRENKAQFGERKVWLNTVLVPLKDSQGKVRSVMGISRDITAQKEAVLALEESEARLRTLSESAAEAIVIHDKGIILDVNLTGCRLFGYDLKEVVEMNVLDFAAPESKDLVLKNIQQGYEKPYEAIGLRKDGSTFIGEVIGKPIPYRGRTVRATVIRDITFRKQMEKTLQLVMEGTSAATGEDFFKELVRSLAQAMNMEIAFITQRDSANPRVVRSISMWIKDQIVENIKWEVKNTPCDQVIAGKTIIVSRGVQTKFPRDLWLHEVKAESYLAVPIVNEEGKVVGHMGVLDSKPMEDPQRLENIIQIFAVRAGAELQRLQSHEEIVRLKEFNESILNGMAEGVVVLDSEGIMKYVNPATEPLLGYTGEELLGQHWSLIIPEDQYTTVYAVDKRRMKGESSVYDLQLVRKDGQRIDVWVSGSSRFKDGEFIGTIAVFTDITEQKQAMEALEASESFNRTVLTSVSEGVIVYDRQFRYVVWNSFMESLTGYKAEEVLGKCAFDLFPFLKEQGIDKLLIRALKGETVTSPDIHFTIPGTDQEGWAISTYAPHRGVNGEIVGVVGLVRNITERKQKEEELRNSEERYRSILENIDEGYYEVDLKGNFKFFNDSLCRMLNYSRDELMGMNNREYMDRESAERVYKVFNKVYRTGKSSKTIDIKIKRNEGEIKFGAISISLLKDSSNKPVGFRGIVRDITERKQAEEALRKSKANLVAAQRIAHIGSWEWDVLTDTAIWSDETYRIFGVEPHELEEHRQNFLDKVHPDDRARVDQALSDAISGKKEYNLEYRIVLPNKREKVVHARAEVIRNDEGKAILMRGTVHDITERKRTEEERRRSEENLNNLFRFTTDAIIIQNRKREILDCNAAAEELFGYSREELITDPTIQLGDPGKTDETKRGEYLERAIQGQPQRFEWWGKRKDGSSFPEEIILNRTIYNGEEVVFITIRDITERKKAETALRESEAFLNGVLTSIQDGVSVLNPDLTVRYVNNIMKEWYSKNLPLEGKKCFQCYHNANQPCDPCPSLRCLESGKTESDIVPGLPGSEVEWLELYSFPMKDLVTGNVTGVVEFVRDITKRKHAEQEITTMANALKSISECVSITDEKDQLLFVNEAFLKTYGYTWKEVIGRSIREVVGSTKNPPEVVKEILPATIRGGWQGELINRRKDGSEFPISLSTSPVRNEEDEVVALIGVAEDITKRKKAELDIKHRAELEMLIASVSSKMVKRSFEEIDTTINEALADIGTFSGADRAYVFRLFNNGSRMDNTHEWCAKGIEPQIENLKNLSVSIFPWWMEKLNHFENIHIPRVADLPPEASAEKEILQQQDIQSLIVVPMIVQNILTGFIGFDSVRSEKTWLEEDIVLLRLLGETIAVALEQRRSILKLKESESSFRGIYDHATDAIYIQDKEGRFLDVNQGAIDMYGYPREFFIGKTPEPLSAPGKNDMQKIAMYIEKAFKGEPQQFEFWGKRKNGEIFPKFVRLTKSVYFGQEVIIAFALDITESKQAETRLKESEEKFRSLFEESRDVIYISTSEGKLIDINPAAEKLFGYTKEEMLKIDAEDLYVNKEDRHRFLSQVNDQGFVEEFEVPLKKKDGTVIHCLITTIRRRTAEGTEQLQGIIHDISKRKMAEEALRMKMQDLDRANKLMVGRELRMIELKKEVNELLEKAGLSKKYSAPEEIQ